MESMTVRPEEKLESLQFNVDFTAGPNKRIIAKARDHVVITDVFKEMGGDDSGPTPPEYMCIALGGCLYNICRIMATERQIDMNELLISVRGNIDPSRAFGLETDARAGFTEIKVEMTYPSDMPKHIQEEFHRELLARCPLCDTLHNVTPLEVSVVPAISSES